ncbi:hypothetical protein [Alishewanella jeotgali]|uniref:Uncharacterized protein n=1 Tax=Alishewanella jeotgali KCTC 22429 TaxID=1129374 RepID=H3ZEV2_9ALTE|nr:hypothetical protein [Alishewanella jeotgali]EHR40904.1 hypothetical protein AJE_09434 [Alishewanella jeotgali KCTC 22429]
MVNKSSIKFVFRLLFWVAFFSFIGALLSSKSIETEENVLLAYSLAGGAIGGVLAIIFNSRSK